MSENSEPRVSHRRAIKGLIVIGMILVFEFALWATLRGCFGNCPKDVEVWRFFQYPGSLVIAIPAVILVAVWAMRKDRND